MVSFWDYFLKDLDRDHSDAHRLFAPCTVDRILEVQRDLGPMPPPLHEMLKRFNGGELFINAIPLITLLGLSLPEKVMYWPADWYIENSTRTLRLANGALAEWVFAITNYGDLITTNQLGECKQWQMSQLDRHIDLGSLENWLQQVLEEGNVHMTS